MSDPVPTLGETYEVDYPFVRCTFSEWDEEGCHSVKSWRPGCEYDVDDWGNAGAYCNGMGKQLLTVVSVHKPGKYPTRIFFTRQWRDPDGKAFGKGSLRICTLEKFRRLAKGFMAHDPYFEYEIEAAE